MGEDHYWRMIEEAIPTLPHLSVGILHFREGVAQIVYSLSPRDEREEERPEPSPASRKNFIVKAYRHLSQRFNLLRRCEHHVVDILTIGPCWRISSCLKDFIQNVFRDGIMVIDSNRAPLPYEKF